MVSVKPATPWKFLNSRVMRLPFEQSAQIEAKPGSMPHTFRKPRLTANR